MPLFSFETDNFKDRSLVELSSGFRLRTVFDAVEKTGQAFDAMQRRALSSGAAALGNVGQYRDYEVTNRQINPELSTTPRSVEASVDAADNVSTAELEAELARLEEKEKLSLDNIQRSVAAAYKNPTPVTSPPVIPATTETNLNNANPQTADAQLAVAAAFDVPIDETAWLHAENDQFGLAA